MPQSQFRDYSRQCGATDRFSSTAGSSIRCLFRSRAPWGADVVIAVELGCDILGRRFRATSAPQAASGTMQRWMRELQENLGCLAREETADDAAMPSMLDVLATCMGIVEVRIARSRMAGEPPELVVAPRLARLRLLDFHKAEEAIEQGQRAVQRVAHNLALLNEDVP